MNKALGNLFKGDKVVWMVFFFLCIISVVEVYSASSFLTYKGGSYMAPLIKHAGLLFVGLICMIITLNIKCKYFKITTPFMLLVSYIMAIWVLFAPKVNDAGRWINLLGIQFQPSEIAKGTMVLLTAQILSFAQTEEGADKHAFWWITATCAPMICLIAVENLSTAMLITITLFMMMLVGRVPMKQIGGTFGVGVICIVMAVSFIMLAGKTEKQAPTNLPDKEMVAEANVSEAAESVGQKGSRGGILHRVDLWKGRIYDFLDSRELPPDSVDIRGKGAQVAFSNIAIASSGIKGVGPGNSVERDFLSQAFSDFIYAIIIEEFGLFGAAFVAFLYVVLLMRVGKIANRCENNFPAFFAMGLALMLVVQAMFNMCVAVGLAPVTGQPLPLISKGGTSTIINCIYIGVILSISRSAKKRSGNVSKTTRKTHQNTAEMAL